MRSNQLAAALCLTMLVSAGTATATPTTLDDVLARQYAQSGAAPGIAARVSAPGLEWSGHFGTSDRATGVPLRPGDTFRIASITKTFTAAAMLRLVDQRRIRLDAPIAVYLPDPFPRLLRSGGYGVELITVRQLLTHTSGLYDYAADDDFLQTALSDLHHRWTPVEQVAWAMDRGRPYGQPGAQYHYSDTGYVLLARIIEAVTHLPQATAYRALLCLRGLGLSSTWFETLEPAPATAGPRAHQYLVDPSSGLEVDTHQADPSFDLYGGGGLVSNLADLTRFFRALLDGRLLSSSSLRTMLTVTTTSPDHTAAMGIFTKVVAGETCWWHNGAWGSATLYCPARHLAVSVTINAFVTDHSTPGALTDAVALATAYLES